MKILVTGATGKVGKHLVNHLLNDGHQVRALTRNPTAAQFPDGVEVIKGNLMQPESLTAAFEGLDGLHLINFGDDNVRLENGETLVALAKAAGVQRITVLGDHETGSVEEAVIASGIAWTMLRPVAFMGNLIADWAGSILTEGVVRQGYLTVKSAVVHESDIAAVAAAALTQDGHGGQSYIITGPEALTPVEMVATLSRAIGREIQLIELTEAQMREQWQAEGYSPEDIEFFVWMQSNPPAEGYTVVDTVERVTGRPARIFAEWAAEHADHFR